MGGVIEILLVEDNPGDVRLTREALRIGEVRNRLHVVPDGVEAMAFLRQQGRYQGMPRPDLVLLDLNLPKKSGREVLAEAKSDPALANIPVVVLTTSRADDDVASAYDNHANCFVTKPSDLEQFLAVIGGIVNFWSHIARLPA